MSDKIAELNELVGQITGVWAQVEDGLFHLFVVALTGNVAGDVRPYRAVFFAQSSYEGKMRMTDGALKTRFEGQEEILEEWKVLRKAMNDFAKLRNEVAQMIATSKQSDEPNAEASVRLIPAFWRSGPQIQDYEVLGYSADELWQALRPFWGFHPRINLGAEKVEATLGYRVQQFALRLLSKPTS